MNIGTIVLTVVAAAVVLIPAALVWYVNLGGIAHAVRETRAKRVTVKA